MSDPKPEEKKSGDPYTPKWYFETILAPQLKNHPERGKLVDAIFCFKIAGDRGGEWTVDCVNTMSCHEGDTGKTQCTLEIEDINFERMLVDPSAGMELFYSDPPRMRIAGEEEIVRRMQHVFRITERCWCHPREEVKK